MNKVFDIVGNEITVGTLIGVSKKIKGNKVFIYGTVIEMTEDEITFKMKDAYVGDIDEKTIDMIKKNIKPFYKLSTKKPKFTKVILKSTRG